MELERLWGRDPGWFESCDRSTQERLYAHYVVYATEFRRG